MHKFYFGYTLAQKPCGLQKDLQNLVQYVANTDAISFRSIQVLWIVGWPDQPIKSVNITRPTRIIKLLLYVTRGKNQLKRYGNDWRCLVLIVKCVCEPPLDPSLHYSFWLREVHHQFRSSETDTGRFTLLTGVGKAQGVLTKCFYD